MTQKLSLRAKLYKTLGYQFKNTDLVELALTHRSHSATHNERLEFLGDSILNYLMAEVLYQRFHLAREGDLSRMRAYLVKGETLAELAKKLSLGQHLNLGSGELKSGGYNRDSILANAMEALIAALYLDAGMNICRERVSHWYAEKIDHLSMGNDHKDFKTQLQEWLQARKQALPTYQLIATSGKNHIQKFTVSCEVVLLKQSVTASSGSRRSAEQSAAAEALKQLQSKHNK